jgi:WD40 repeat protein
MGESYIVKKSGGGGDGLTFDSDEITVIAENQIQIGDIVYTVTENADFQGELRNANVFIASPRTAAFSPDGTLLVLSGDFIGRAKRYSVSGTTVTYLGDIFADNGTTALTSTVNAAAFSPDGTLLVLGGSFIGIAKRYSVSGTTVAFLSNIFADNGTTILNDVINAVAFNPAGTLLVLGGNFTGRAKRYSVSGTTVTYLSDIFANAGTTILDNPVNAAAFNPDGTLLVLGGLFTGRAKRYSVSGNTVTYLGDIFADGGTTALSSTVSAVAFNPAGTLLVLGGSFTGRAKRYSVSGTTVTYLSDIFADNGTTILNDVINAVAFNPAGTLLVLGGFFTGFAKRYSVSGTTVAYLSDIFADNGTTALGSIVGAAAFSPAGTLLVLGGGFTGRAKRYSVSGTTVAYLSDIFTDNITTTVLSNLLRTAAFSPDGTLLVLGGDFIGCAKRYSVSGTTVTYLGDIFADGGTTVLNTNVSTAAFNPAGTMLVLGGFFTGRAKRYSVSGTTVTYQGDIYADGGTTALSSAVNAAPFNPAGTLLVLGGAFTDRAKFYSVSGTTVTYQGDIYADGGTTILDNTVNAAAFNPAGTLLVLGGLFTGRAKRYSVSGTTVSYLSDIYADGGTTILDNPVNAAAFNPAGTLLVLGGNFTGRAKRYSVSGTTVTFLGNIFANVGITALSSTVSAVAFNPAGTLLVLGGDFTDRAKRYSVSDTTVTFLSDIYADAGSTALSSTVTIAAFNPAGTLLVLGGNFIGFGKLYIVLSDVILYGVVRKAYNTYPIPILDYVNSIYTGFATNSANVGENVTIKAIKIAR